MNTFLLFYLYNYDGDEKEADKMQPKIKEQKKYLLKYLRNIGEENQFESILEECRNSARAEYDRRIAEIIRNFFFCQEPDERYATFVYIVKTT